VDRTEKEYAAAQIARMQEIKMVDQAIQIITSKVSSKVVNSMVQKSQASFIQISSSKASDVNLEKQQRLARFLREKGIGFNSKVLIQMAQLAAASPFDKVIKMIKQLVLKLTNEVQEATEVSGWCDTKLAEHAGKIDRAMSKQSTAKTCIDANNANSDDTASKLEDRTESLSKTVQDLADLRSDFSDLKSESETEISDQKSASEGLSEAIEVLRSFYENEDSTAAIGTGNMDLSDETGNDTGSFAGDFAAKEGTGVDQNTNTAQAGNSIITFLEEIFTEITVDIQKRTTDLKQAESAFVESEREMVGEKARLESFVRQDKARLKKLKDTVADCSQDLEMGKDSAREQNEYYANVIEKKCVTDDVTFKEKSEKRQAEITSLNEALTILENA